MSQRIKLFFIKMYRWEFWPGYIFNIPVVAYYIVQGLRTAIITRNLKKGFFYNFVNPGVEMIGKIEKKYEMLSQFNSSLCPITFLFTPGENAQKFIEKVEKKLSFPAIFKPNAGLRGLGKTRNAKLIQNKTEAHEYLKGLCEPIIAQEYINKPLEFGVFYVKLPGELCGRVTSLTQKNLFTVTGDGKSNVKELILKDTSRGIFYIHLFLKNIKEKHKLVLKKNETMLIQPIGAHSRGTEFRDFSHKITPQLEKTIDAITKQIPGISYGRYDVKTDSFADLEKGNFKILELNTWLAEPIHFYDPSYKLVQAYKVFFWHINAMWKISLATKKNK